MRCEPARTLETQDLDGTEAGFVGLPCLAPGPAHPIASTVRRLS